MDNCLLWIHRVQVLVELLELQTYATNFDKAPYGGANKLLIDDRTTYIDQFEAAGGKGFKYFESGGIKDFGGSNMSVTLVSA